MHPFLIFIMVIISLIVIAVAYFFFAVSKAISDASSDYEKRQKCQEDFILNQLEELKKDNNYSLNATNPCKNSSNLLIRPTQKIENKIREIRESNTPGVSKDSTKCSIAPLSDNISDRQDIPTTSTTLKKIKKFMRDNLVLWGTLGNDKINLTEYNAFSCDSVEEQFEQNLSKSKCEIDANKLKTKIVKDIKEQKEPNQLEIKRYEETERRCVAEIEAEIAAVEAEAKAVEPVIAGVETDTLAMVPNESLEELQQELPKENFGADPFSNIEDFAAF